MLKRLFGRRHSDGELDEEIRSHLDMLAEEHVRRGMTSQDAHHAALREFGGVARTKESYREQRGFPLLDALAQDLRYALRMLRSSPAFTLAAGLSLALGIAANGAIFSVILAIARPSLPYKDAGRILRIRAIHPRSPFASSVALADFMELRRAAKVFPPWKRRGRTRFWQAAKRNFPSG
jgi:hypothetical protein